eukprot:1157233-Pelagomonas_calceolata.AAC.6
MCEGWPGIERTKSASGRLRFWAEESVPSWKTQSGIAQEIFSGTSINVLFQESLISAGIHTNKG